MRACSRLLVLGLLLGPPTALLAACDGPTEPDAAPSESTYSTEAPPGMDESLREAALALVDEREQALRDGDKEAFLATVEPGSDFARTQARWFDNLAELPVTDLSLELGDEGVMSRIHGEGDLQLPVDFTMRLEGYDAEPVTQPLVYTFEGDEDDVLLTSDRNIQNDAFTGWLPAPWDVTDITVAEDDGVLGVFDDETGQDAGSVLAEIVAARDDIVPLLPPWSETVVAYDITDVDAIDKMSTLEIDNTAGVAFPVRVQPGRKKIAAYRFAVNPDNTADDLSRRIVFRHELVHVALADSDDKSPTWLVEGAAEYVALATEWDTTTRRRIFAQALRGQAAAPLATGRDFYQQDPDANYQLAGLSVSYLASTRGPDAPWDLMAAFRRTKAFLPGDVEDLVRSELGLSTKELAARALAWARSA